jgi:hypothetical protein
MSHEKGTWRELCEAASVESDPEKVLELVRRIVIALDEQATAKQQQEHQAGSNSPPKFSSG